MKKKKIDSSVHRKSLSKFYFKYYCSIKRSPKYQCFCYLVRKRFYRSKPIVYLIILCLHRKVSEIRNTTHSLTRLNPLILRRQLYKNGVCIRII